jgi:hypothetical protein
LPTTREEKIQAIDLCIQAGRKLRHWQAVLVFRAREDYGSASEFHCDMSQRFGWEKTYLCHLSAVGEMLWRTRELACHNVLTQVGDVRSLYKITQIPLKDLPRFCSRNPRLGKMDRAAIDTAVNEFLGKGNGRKRTGTAGGGKPRQLDFEDLLFEMVEKTIDDRQHRALVDSDRVKPVYAAINGLDLVKVAAEKWASAQTIDETELEETIDELDTLRDMLLQRLAGASQPLALGE